ncbi:ribonuclease PH [Frondihabitans cladoniiphilus]|uniref:ribonuclease PH n=1 Tax=Frondihabitans cladoniiphilus TaxID=715785 RepID=UPI0031EBF5A9
MKRRAVLTKIRIAARKSGLEFREVELTNHTGVIVGQTRSTLSRHAEIDDVTARKFFDQFTNELGRGWWR